ncbi:helix-turn-helix domain-containing protein [Alphaproteobacteria bacterium]|nr:helix-turn-helix domain-containing protein [Alphaproteobacteria bacterium]
MFESYLQTGVIVLSEETLKRVFGAVWSRFLEFEITRSRMITELTGSLSSGLILQVVAYHNLTLVQSTLDSKTYSEIRGAWELGDQTSNSELPKKLSFAAIADITGIDKETVRRAVKKLEEQEWLSINQEAGISYNPSQTNQDKLLILNEWEVTHLGRLIKRLNDADNAG